MAVLLMGAPAKNLAAKAYSSAAVDALPRVMGRRRLRSLPLISKSPRFEVHIIQEGVPKQRATLFTNPNCRYCLTMEI